jgi:hypothetical protein
VKWMVCNGSQVNSSIMQFGLSCNGRVLVGRTGMQVSKSVGRLCVKMQCFILGLVIHTRICIQSFLLSFQTHYPPSPHTLSLHLGKSMDTQTFIEALSHTLKHRNNIEFTDVVHRRRCFKLGVFLIWFESVLR